MEMVDRIRLPFPRGKEVIERGAERHDGDSPYCINHGQLLNMRGAPFQMDQGNGR